MQFCLIANPHARNGRAVARIQALTAEMDRHGLRYDLRTCGSMDEARILSAEANRNGCDVVVAVGGDGTINRVLNGFFDSDGARLSGKPLGVVHTGTSPDFCLSHAVPTRIVEAVAALKECQAKTIKVGRMNWLTTRRADFFACCANIGFGATLARYANGGVRAYAGDFAGTLVSLLRTLRAYRPRTVEINLDGRSETVSKVYDLAVGRTRHVASGMKISHGLSEADDGFYVVCLHDLSWVRLPSVLRHLYRPPELPSRPATLSSGSRIVRNACLWQTSAQNIRVTTESRTEVEFDGDPAGECPCAIEPARHSLDLICGPTPAALPPNVRPGFDPYE